MKIEVREEEYYRAIEAAGGLSALTVLSAYTFTDGCPAFGPGRHIFTEWGTKDGRSVAESEEHDGRVTYRVDELLVQHGR